MPCAARPRAPWIAQVKRGHSLAESKLLNRLQLVYKGMCILGRAGCMNGSRKHGLCCAAEQQALTCRSMLRRRAWSPPHVPAPVLRVSLSKDVTSHT